MLEHNNIPDPHDQNHELLVRLWDGLKRKGDGKCYFPCNQCKRFQRRRINIATSIKHCREHGHVEGGLEYHPFVSFALYVFLY